jgi:2-C-methyl-D-erythritol 2,4-cyclodiphosphate synthase
MKDIRIGQGIDIHPFAEGRRCVLGGIDIPSAKGLQGYSDADALVHAVIDAVLGALGKRDIGTLFPDTDMQFKDADSCMLLTQVWKIAHSEGWSLGNADITVLAEVPKLKPYVFQMVQKLAAIFDCAEDRIAIKATTTERLGFIGREEGILASAVVLLFKASPT